MTDEEKNEILAIERRSRINYERFRLNSHYIFFMLLVTESANIQGAMTTAFRKASRLDSYNRSFISEADKNTLQRANQGYHQFKAIGGTAPYFHHQKQRLFAMLRQLGPPSLFITISQSEYDLVELMVDILHSKPDVEDIREILKNMKADTIGGLCKDDVIRLDSVEIKMSKEIVLSMTESEMSTLVNNHIVHTTMKKIEDKLPDNLFLKIHRSFIINIKKIVMT